jgi:hypothetical protein
MVDNSSERCTTLNRITEVQVSDTTGDDSSNAVKYKKCQG